MFDFSNYLSPLVVVLDFVSRSVGWFTISRIPAGSYRINLFFLGIILEYLLIFPGILGVSEFVDCLVVWPWIRTVVF